MKKVMIIGCFIAGFLLLIPPSVSAMGYGAVQSNIEKKMETTSVIVHVHGGPGIYIDVYGVTDKTAVSTIVKGFISSDVADAKIVRRNHMYIAITTLAFLPCNFQLYITVYDQIFSYKGHAFYFSVWGITPMNV